MKNIVGGVLILPLVLSISCGSDKERNYDSAIAFPTSDEAFMEYTPTPTYTPSPTSTSSPEPTNTKVPTRAPVVNTPTSTRTTPEPRQTTTNQRTVPTSTPIAAQSPSSTGVNAHLARIRNCESGGNYQAYNPAGYYGAYQFDLATWKESRWNWIT